MTFKYKFNKHQKAWLHDLETTDAKQCRAYLYQIQNDGTPSFCCLGRACVVLEKTLNLTRVQQENQIGFKGAPDLNPLFTVLPQIVQDALKLRQPNGLFRGAAYITYGSKRFGALTELNDEGQLSFAEIAKYCREHPEIVFSDYDEQFNKYRNSNPEC